MFRTVPADEAGIAAGARLIRAGSLVAFPTETVYGLGGDATSAHAVARIFEAKGRPRFNPLIVHVPDVTDAQALAVLDDTAMRLAARFWPGALTMVLPRKGDCPVAPLASAGLETIAVRVPAHPVARALLQAARLPVAAPSANPSGRLSPTRAEHVAMELGDAVDLILDAGAAQAGLESTIVDCTGAAPVLLRAGAIAREDIEQELGAGLAAPIADPDRPSAPGQLASHYAPRAALRLDALRVNEGEGLLAFGANPPAGAEKAGAMLNLSETGDLREAAANLFDMLHRLDGAGFAAIAVMPVPETGLGEAINDRLARAAAPRGVA